MISGNLRLLIKLKPVLKWNVDTHTVTFDRVAACPFRDALMHTLALLACRHTIVDNPMRPRPGHVGKGFVCRLETRRTVKRFLHHCGLFRGASR